MTLDEWITCLLAPLPAALGAVGIVFLASTGIGVALLKGCFGKRYCRGGEIRPSRMLLPGTVLGGNLLALACLFLNSAVLSVPVGVLWVGLALPALYGVWSWREFPFRRRKWSLLILAAAGAAPCRPCRAAGRREFSRWVPRCCCPMRGMNWFIRWRYRFAILRKVRPRFGRTIRIRGFRPIRIF